MSKSKQEHLNFYISSANLARGVVGLIDAMLARGAVKGEEINTISQIRDAANTITRMAEEYEKEAESDTEEQ